jgi:hypothetical protein
MFLTKFWIVTPRKKRNRRHGFPLYRSVPGSTRVPYHPSGDEPEAVGVASGTSGLVHRVPEMSGVLLLYADSLLVSLMIVLVSAMIVFDKVCHDGAGKSP